MALRRRRPATDGLTLVEALIATAIVAITVMTVAPGMGQLIERRHLEGTVAQLETDIHLARSTAVAHEARVRISFTNGPHGTGWVVHRGAASHCRSRSDGEPLCNAPALVIRHEHLASGAPVRLAANVSSILFDPLQGTSTPTGTVRVLGRSGAALHQVVNLMGRVRTCAPAPGMPGYAAC